MHKETTYEFLIAQGNYPAGLSWLFCPCTEDYAVIADRYDPAVGDGNLVSITTKVINCITESVEGFFYVRTPVPAVKGVLKRAPAEAAVSTCHGTGDAHLSGRNHLVKMAYELALELVPEDEHGDEELTFRPADFPVGS